MNQSSDSLISKTLALFFAPERLTTTLTRLVNHNRMFMRDPFFEITCIVMTSPVSVTVLDKGIAFFVKDLSLSLPYKTLTRSELEAIIELLRVEGLKCQNLYMNQQRGGGLCVYLRDKETRFLSHIDVMRSVCNMVLASHVGPLPLKKHLINILLQRFDKTLQIDKKALCVIQNEIRCA